MLDLIEEIRDLKARRDATILAHYYQEGEIQELADFTGDSLKLARAAAQVRKGNNRLLRRAFYGRNGQDAESRETRSPARSSGGLQPRGQLPCTQA